MSGKYSTNAADTPQVLFEGNEGAKFVITRRPQGTGSALPQQKFNAVLTQYEETAPAAGHVMWATQWTRSGPVDRTPQPV